MWIAEWQHNAMAHHCGHQLSVCTDPNRVWYPQRRVDYVAMNEAAARRQYSDLHEEKPWHDGTFSRWTAERTSATPYRYDDGVEIFVTEVDWNPGDEFLKSSNPFDERID